MTPEIPGFQLLREIGKGGMGMVYLARREKDDAQVAIKVLPPNLLTSNSARRFQREGRALQSVKHPNIVEVYDTNAVQGLHYLVMEYLEGSPLSRIVRTRGGGLPVDEALHYARSVGAALAEIHGRGMTHRDLKPSNIIVTKDGTPKLLDFGLVQVDGLTMLTATGNVIGTPAYMSPEQCEGRPLDHRADVYSFGAVLYELLTGQPPFVSESVYDLLDMHKNSSPAALRSRRKDVDGEIEQIVMQCLEKDPARRPASIQQVLASLGSGTWTPSAAPGVVPVASAGGGSGGRWAALVLVAVIGAGVGTLVLHPEGAALRGRLTRHFQKSPDPAATTPSDKSLTDSVQARFDSLRRASGLFEQGNAHEEAGEIDDALRLYVEATTIYPKVEYFEALVRIAKTADREDSVADLVREYVQRPDHEDPRGTLSRWLEERP